MAVNSIQAGLRTVSGRCWLSEHTSAITSRSMAYYEHDVDFDALAEKDKDFAAICKVSKVKNWIDFKDPKVVQ